MRYLFYGIPAYLLFEGEMLDLRTPVAAELDPETPVRVLPLDSSPAYFVTPAELAQTVYPGLVCARVPASPLAYAEPYRILHTLEYEDTVFRVVSNGVLTLEIRGGAAAEFPLPRGLGRIMSRCGGNRGVLTFALTASVPDGKYLFVARRDPDWTVAIDKTCRRIEQTEGRTLLLSLESASGLAGRVDVYDEAFLPVESYPVFTGVAATDRAPVLLFDYLRLGRDEEAARLLSAELLADTPLAAVKEFFAPYQRIEPAVAADLYALYRSETEAELYEFCTVDGLIDDIVEAVHPLAAPPARA